MGLKLEIDEALKSTLKDRAGRALFLSNLGKSKLKSLMNNPDMGRFPNVDDKCFNGPVMFISGERQPSWANDDDTRRIKQIFPNSHFVKIPGAGHWVHLEKTDDFLSAVVSFLQTLMTPITPMQISLMTPITPMKRSLMIAITPMKRSLMTPITPMRRLLMTPIIAMPMESW